MERTANPAEFPEGEHLILEADVLVETDIGTTIDGLDLVALAEHVLLREGARGAWLIAFVITTDDHLRRLHRDFMGIDRETDVMTFPAGTDLDGEGRGGDIVISADRAAEQASEYSHTLREEIRFLAVHGLLHLLGWTDETADGRTAMLDRQRQLIDDIAASGSV